MRLLLYIIFLLILVACSNRQGDNQKDRVTNDKPALDSINGLTNISEKWTLDTPFYWTLTEPDSFRKKINVVDTASYSTCFMTKIYSLTYNDSLQIKKVIEINLKTNQKVTEEDYYTKQLDPFYKSVLHLAYDFQTNSYSADLIDSSETYEKWKANRSEVDSILAEKSDLIVCGTAIQRKLWPPAIKRKTTKDTALIIINDWTKE